MFTAARSVGLLVVLTSLLLVQGCALGPTKEQKRDMAFNLVFNVVTVKAAATMYSAASFFSFGTNKVLDSFDNIAESDKDKVKAFAALGEQMPEGLMKAISTIRPTARDIIFKKPEYIDQFVDTAAFKQGVAIAQKANRWGLPDLTKELDDKQIALWMQVFMSSKEKVKEISEPLSDWNVEARKFFNISL